MQYHIQHIRYVASYSGTQVQEYLKDYKVDGNITQILILFIQLQQLKLTINNKLRLELDTWKAYVQPENESDYIFKGRFGEHLTRQSMDKKLKRYSPFKGVSTHSFRRSCLTAMNRAKVPLNVIASLSGHSSMNSLRLYLGIDEKEQIEAINCL